MASTKPVNVGGTPYELGVSLYLKGESPSPIKQPHVCKHGVLDGIAFDPARRWPLKIYSYYFN